MSEKVKQILAYVFGWVGGLIILFAFKDNTKKTVQHAGQSIIISGGYSIILAVSTMLFIPFIGLGLYVLYLILMIMGIVKACQEGDPTLPIVGDLAKNWFSKYINEAREDGPTTQNNTYNQPNNNYNQIPPQNNPNDPNNPNQPL